MEDAYSIHNKSKYLIILSHLYRKENIEGIG